MGRLAVGDRIPDFSVETLRGETLGPADLRGRRALLSFRRYAACPVCNQHLATFRVRAAAELGSRGITMYAVFHSPRERLLQYFDPNELPFEVLVDPELAVYEAFGVTSRRLALLHPGTLRTVVSAALSGQGSPASADVDKTREMIPANFLLDSTRGGARIVAAHYGKHLGDAWSVERVVELADGIWGGEPTTAAPTAASPDRAPA